MRAYDAAHILLRLLGLWLLIFALSYIPMWSGLLFASGDFWMVLQASFPNLVIGSLYAGTGVIFWLYTHSVARWLVPKVSLQSGEKYSVSENTQAWLQAGVSLIGVYLLVTWLPAVFVTFYRVATFVEDANSLIGNADVNIAFLRAVINVIVGGLVVIFRKSIASRLSQ